MTSQGSVASGITPDDLAKVSRTKVFFGHQSVGMNVLDGVPGVYAAHGMTAPPIGAGRYPAGQDGGFVGHAFIGENEKPLLKIQDFGAKMRSGIGEQVDVAMMKLCYVDITERHGRRRAVRHVPRDHHRPGAGLPGGHLRPCDRAAD